MTGYVPSALELNARGATLPPLVLRHMVRLRMHAPPPMPTQLYGLMAIDAAADTASPSHTLIDRQLVGRAAMAAH